MSLVIGVAVGAVIVFFLVAATAFLHLIKLKQKLKSVSHLWALVVRDFRQKIWMTAGLGLLFICLFLAALAGGETVLRAILIPEKGVSFSVHLVNLVYAGLFIFALLSLLIYLVRMGVKYLYRKHLNKRL